MPYCSIQEAFPDTATQSGVVARKQERKRANKCGGPALAFLKGIDEDDKGYGSVDPDRQAERPMPPPESMNNKPRGSNVEGFLASPTTSELENLIQSEVKDVIGQNQGTTTKQVKALTAQAKQIDETNNTSYFGRSVEEGYADFSSSLTDNPGYQVMPADFLGSFGAVGVNKASGKAALATPSVNDAWKPLTPSGARTSFFEHLPYPGGSETSESTIFSREEKETLLKKLDTLFAKLEDLESKQNEYAHAEITLFVLSGLFLLYGLNAVKKIGSSRRFL